MQTLVWQSLRKEGGVSWMTCWTRSLDLRYSLKRFMNIKKWSLLRMLPGIASKTDIHSLNQHPEVIAVTYVARYRLWNRHSLSQSTSRSDRCYACCPVSPLKQTFTLSINIQKWSLLRMLPGIASETDIHSLNQHPEVIAVTYVARYHLWNRHSLSQSSVSLFFLIL